MVAQGARGPGNASSNCCVLTSWLAATAEAGARDRLMAAGGDEESRCQPATRW